MHSINNCMDADSAPKNAACLTVVWKRCKDGALPVHWLLLSCIIPTPCVLRSKLMGQVYQRVGRLSSYVGIYAILKQKAYSYLTTQPSSFRAPMISNTNIHSWKPCGRQKCAVAKRPFFLFFLQRKYLENGLSTHYGCSMKTIHTSTRISPDP